MCEALYRKSAYFLPQALNTEDWSDGEPTDSEKDFWEIAAMEAYSHLTEWKSLQYCSTVGIDESSPPNLEKMWSEPLYQVIDLTFHSLGVLSHVPGRADILHAVMAWNCILYAALPHYIISALHGVWMPLPDSLVIFSLNFAKKKKIILYHIIVW